MTKIMILGGTGLIGGKVAARLRTLGHEVAAVSRSTGVDSRSGAGLADALAGATIVLDTAGPRPADLADAGKDLTASSLNLAAAEREAGVKRHVLLSIIGASTVGGGLFAAKADQERVVETAPVPFTIVRSAPFFETLYDFVGASSDEVLLPSVVVQPVAADDVAAALVEMLFDPEAGPLIEIGGPESRPLSDFAEEILAANEDDRRVRTGSGVLFLGARMDGQTLIAFERARLGPTMFEDWLRHYFFRHALAPAVRPPHLRIRSSRGSERMTPFIDPAAAPSGAGCAECLVEGGWWFHLRRCAQCGHVGCCESSPSQHAAGHFHSTGHPVIQSFEPGEDWYWDYRTDTLFEGPVLAPPSSRPASQPAPGPAGAVPANWTRQLHHPRQKPSSSKPGELA